MFMSYKAYAYNDVCLMKHIINELGDAAQCDYDNKPFSVTWWYNELQAEHIRNGTNAGYSGVRKVGAVYMFYWRFIHDYYDPAA
jgi:hypothetical protein